MILQFLVFINIQDRFSSKIDLWVILPKEVLFVLK